MNATRREFIACGTAAAAASLFAAEPEKAKATAKFSAWDEVQLGKTGIRGKVRAVLAGHQHVGGQDFVNGISYYTLGAMVSGAWPDSNCYAEAAVYPSGKFTIATNDALLPPMPWAKVPTAS